MNETQKNEFLLEYIFDYMSDASHEEFVLTIFFLSALIFEKTNQLIIYMNELVDGIDICTEFKKINQFLGTGLEVKQILKGIKEIQSRGLLLVESIDGSNYGFVVTYLDN